MNEDPDLNFPRNHLIQCPEYSFIVDLQNGLPVNAVLSRKRHTEGGLFGQELVFLGTELQFQSD